jgi:hypothetical protein
MGNRASSAGQTNQRVGTGTPVQQTGGIGRPTQQTGLGSLGSTATPVQQTSGISRPTQQTGSLASPAQQTGGISRPTQQTGPSLNFGPPNPYRWQNEGPPQISPTEMGQLIRQGEGQTQLQQTGSLSSPAQQTGGIGRPVQPASQPVQQTRPVNFNPASAGQTFGPSNPPRPAQPAGRSIGVVDWRPPTDLHLLPSGMTVKPIGQQEPAQPINPVLQRRQQRLEQVNPQVAEFMDPQNRSQLYQLNPVQQQRLLQQGKVSPESSEFGYQRYRPWWLERVQPVQPAQPARPTQPAQPAQPVQPVQPTQPVQPAQPAQPVQPVQPTQPLSVYAPATAYAAPTMWYGVGGQSSGYLGPGMQVLFQPSSVTYGQMVAQGAPQAIADSGQTLPLAANILSPYLMQMS